MQMTLKRIVIASLGLLAGFATAQASASEYPDRLITIVVPFPAGSTSDMIPRLLGPLLTKSLGVPIVVENRAGANGSIGASRAATAAPDGYTLLMATTGVFAINQWIYAKPLYSPERDFVPLVNAASTANMIVVNPSVKASTLSELVALAKAQPGVLTFASAGNGSTSHICGEALKVLGGIDIVHVPYQGPAPALQDLLGDRVSMICDNFSNVVQQVKAGQLKAIVVTAQTRNAQLPNVPSSPEAGMPDLDAGISYGFLAIAGTPATIVEKLNKAFVEALRDPTVVARLESVGLTVVADKPDEFKAFIAKESARMENIVRQSKARIQ
jgi:tripartite-type tricarboxylate transporter receptor subunit TctC